MVAEARQTYTAVQQPLTRSAVTDTRCFNNGPFIQPDTHTNIHIVYNSFFHYQSDELQILQVGSLRGKQLFGNEVSLVRWKSLYRTVTTALVSAVTQPFITKFYYLTLSLSISFCLAKAATSARELCGVWSYAPVRADAQSCAVRDNS